MMTSKVKDVLVHLGSAILIFALYVVCSIFIAKAFPTNRGLAMCISDVSFGIFSGLFYRQYVYKPRLGERYKFSPIAMTIMGVVFLGLFVTSQLLGYGIFGIAKEAYFELYGNLTERELRWYVVLAVFGSPFVEELLFRGILYRYLSQSIPKWICFVLSTLLFIWVHGSYTHIFVTLAVSCMSVWLIEITEAIWPSFIMHALYNVLGISFQLSMPVPSWIYIIGFWLLFDLVCVGIIRSDFFRDLCRYGRFPSVESMIDEKRKELGRKIDSGTDV